MSDIISRKALIDEIKAQRRRCRDSSPKRYFTAGNILTAIYNAPNVDAVEVVRCKECKHLMFSDFYGECRKGYLGIVKPDDYCSYGERRENENYS